MSWVFVRQVVAIFWPTEYNMLNNSSCLDQNFRDKNEAYSLLELSIEITHLPTCTKIYYYTRKYVISLSIYHLNLTLKVFVLDRKGWLDNLLPINNLIYMYHLTSKHSKTKLIRLRLPLPPLLIYLCNACQHYHNCKSSFNLLTI